MVPVQWFTYSERRKSRVAKAMNGITFLSYWAGAPEANNCGKSSVALLALRPRPDLRLAPGSIDLEVRTWDQPAPPSHSGGQRRFPYWVGKLASVCIRSRFPSGLGPDRPRQSAFPAMARSSRFPTRSTQQVQLRRKERQCISKSSLCPSCCEATYDVEGRLFKRNTLPCCF